MFLIIFFPRYNNPHSYQVEDFVCSAICTVQYNYSLHLLFLRKTKRGYAVCWLWAQRVGSPLPAGLTCRQGSHGPVSSWIRCQEQAVPGFQEIVPSMLPSAPQQRSRQPEFICGSQLLLPLHWPCWDSDSSAFIDFILYSLLPAPGAALLPVSPWTQPLGAAGCCWVLLGAAGCRWVLWDTEPGSTAPGGPGSSGHRFCGAGSLHIAGEEN